MKLMFVRHAEPWYAIDSLTEKGHREAELLSHRLCKLDVKAFYTSPLGRARETGRYTLETGTMPKLERIYGAPVQGQPFHAEPKAATTWVNAADEVMAQYPGVIEID